MIHTYFIPTRHTSSILVVYFSSSATNLSKIRGTRSNHPNRFRAALTTNIPPRKERISHNYTVSGTYMIINHQQIPLVKETQGSQASTAALCRPLDQVLCTSLSYKSRSNNNAAPLPDKEVSHAYFQSQNPPVAATCSAVRLTATALGICY